MVELVLGEVGFDSVQSRPVVVLRQRTPRGRLLRLWVSESEAITVALAHRHLDAPRPGVHALVGDVLARCGRSLQRVLLTSRQADTVHAALVLDDAVEVPARAVDAVVLALRLGAPIHALDALFSQASTDRSSVHTLSVHTADGRAGRSEIDDLSRFLDTVSPDDDDPG